MKTILVVDDEPRIVQLARDYLVGAGFSVRDAGRGEQALAIAHAEKPDLIVLDLGLPDRDGLDVTRALRRESEVPIIILTARGEEADKLVGLELGADDYLTKPFSPRELVARIRAVLRRAEARAAPREIVREGDLTLDVSRRKATRAGRVIELTASEFQLLLTLASQPGRIFTRSQLLDALHGTAFESYERAIDAHMKNVRKKLEPDPRRPRYLLTVYGVGYKFRDEAES
jgi:two-component system alkaline phosphatase synthesis response regulator PhoP